MDPLEILTRYMPILSLRELSFDEKVGYIAGREAAIFAANGHEVAPEKLAKITGVVRSILLGNQSRILKDAAVRGTIPSQQQSRSRKPAIAPVLTKKEYENRIAELNLKIKNVDMNDPEAGQKYKRFGDELAKIQTKLESMSNE